PTGRGSGGWTRVVRPGYGRAMARKGIPCAAIRSLAPPPTPDARRPRCARRRDRPRPTRSALTARRGGGGAARTSVSRPPYALSSRDTSCAAAAAGSNRPSNGCQWRSKMSHLWRLKMSHSAGGDEPLVRRRLPAASLPPRSIVPRLAGGGLEGPVELGVVAHAVAVAADAHDVAVVEQAVDQRGRHDLVAKDLAPLLEALVAGEHGRGRLVAPGHELEEEHGPGAAHWQIADLVHHEDGRVGEHLEPLLELARGLRLFQAGDEVGERAVVDAPAALGCGNGAADGQVGLADAGRAEEDHVLLALHKAQLVQALDLLAPDARLEAEVEALERLDRRQSGGAHGGLEAAVVSEFDLGRQQRFDRLCAGQCPAVHAGEYRVDLLQCAGHLEIGQHAPDPLSQRGGRLHRAPPATAA